MAGKSQRARNVAYATKGSRMSQKKTDLRVRRTHVLLKQAFLDLCEEKGFKVITVGDIAGRAMINRVTFYRHYKDKYELARAVFDEAIEDIDKGLGPPRYTYEQIEEVGPPQPFVRFFEYIAANSRLYRVMMGSDGDPWFVTHMREHLSTFVEQRILAREKLRLASPKDMPEGMSRKVAVSITAACFVGIISWWLEDGMKHSPAQMAAWLRRIVLKGLLGGSVRAG